MLSVGPERVGSLMHLLDASDIVVEKKAILSLRLRLCSGLRQSGSVLDAAGCWQG